MTAAELIKKLKRYPKDAIVVLDDRKNVITEGLREYDVLSEVTTPEGCAGSKCGDSYIRGKKYSVGGTLCRHCRFVILR